MFTFEKRTIYEQRREVVFLVLAGIFLGSLTMLNILGISRFLDLSFELFGVIVPFKLAVGVLAYPITFLCTDFISELYGKQRANILVWVGLLLNIWVLFILWLGAALPPTEHIFNVHVSYDSFHMYSGMLDSISSIHTELNQMTMRYGIQHLDSIATYDPGLSSTGFPSYVATLDSLTIIHPELTYVNFHNGVHALDSIAAIYKEISYEGLPALPSIDNYKDGNDWAFFRIKQLTFGAVTASMVAYLAAQFVDVHVFHFLKRLTKGKHLWIRNNFSTLTSQMVDSTAVILITFYYAHALPVDRSQPIFPQLLVYIFSAYLFKMAAALIDTVPFYMGVKFLSKYLDIDTSYKPEEK